MQRTATAVYVAFFVLVAAGSYGVVATASPPPVELQNPDHVLQSGDTFTVGGTEHTLASVESTTTGGGHGAAATTTSEGTFTWTEPVTKTLELENNTTVTRNGANWTVVIPNVSDPQRFRLVEDAPNPRTQNYRQGGNWNRTATVQNVTAEAAVVAYPGTEEMEETVSEGGNVTLGGTTFTVHYPDVGSAQLTTDYADYTEERAEIAAFEQRIAGFWAVSIIAGLSGIFLLGMAYLPRRG